jgi:hypothetical protein
MGPLRDENSLYAMRTAFRRWALYAMGPLRDGPFTRWALYTMRTAFTRWALYAMGPLRDENSLYAMRTAFTRWALYYGGPARLTARCGGQKCQGLPSSTTYPPSSTAYPPSSTACLPSSILCRVFGGSTRSRWPSCARERRARATRSTAIWWSSCRASAAVLRKLNANQLACCVLTAHGTADQCMLHCSGLRSQRFPLGCSVQWRAVGRMIHCAHVSQVTRVHWTTASRAARGERRAFPPPPN